MQQARGGWWARPQPTWGYNAYSLFKDDGVGELPAGAIKATALLRRQDIPKHPTIVIIWEPKAYTNKGKRLKNPYYAFICFGGDNNELYIWSIGSTTRMTFLVKDLATDTDPTNTNADTKAPAMLLLNENITREWLAGVPEPAFTQLLLAHNKQKAADPKVLTSDFVKDPVFYRDDDKDDIRGVMGVCGYNQFGARAPITLKTKWYSRADAADAHVGVECAEKWLRAKVVGSRITSTSTYTQTQLNNTFSAEMLQRLADAQAQLDEVQFVIASTPAKARTAAEEAVMKLQLEAADAAAAAAAAAAGGDEAAPGAQVLLGGGAAAGAGGGNEAAHGAEVLLGGGAAAGVEAAQGAEVEGAAGGVVDANLLDNLGGARAAAAGGDAGQIIPHPPLQATVGAPLLLPQPDPTSGSKRKRFTRKRAPKAATAQDSTCAENERRGKRNKQQKHGHKNHNTPLQQ